MSHSKTTLRGLLLLLSALVCLAAGQESQPGGEKPPSTETVAPQGIFAPNPGCTADARRRGIQGKVSLRFEVLTDGTTGNIRVVKTLDPELDQAALEEIVHWRFQPATKGGIPVAKELIAEMKFSCLSEGIYAGPGPLGAGIYSGLPCAAKIDSRDLDKLLRKASRGDPNAQFTVGCVYEYGAGPRMDEAQAISWYRKAAENGLASAQGRLGHIYLFSFDYVQAFAWLKIADLNGYKNAKDDLKIVTQLLSPPQLSEAETQ